ncbi:hypothetical protein CTAYLR_000502 [Chrysophaeum taylorii]|uniref:Tyrosinase copper-binding domain-containing protein n=1 Tax=Chrysophaeum taylorii TaxID=2483200 RepID=A0AAD7UGQ8_9STRA|nr:hypothetical protein CTAYLR_000502 [Chrysophaeum taylorii]
MSRVVVARGLQWSGVVVSLTCFYFGMYDAGFGGVLPALAETWSSSSSSSPPTHPDQSLGASIAMALQDEQNELPNMIQEFFAQRPIDQDASTHVLRMSQDKEAASKVDIKVVNSYTASSPTESGVKYGYPWKYLAEPYRPSRLIVVGSREDAWYKWVVDGHTQGYGSVVDVVWTSVGWKNVALVERANGTTTCLLAANIMVKYTRREIRSLSDLDRETFFQAAMVLQRVPTEVGIRLYGKKYRSKDYFNRIHLYFGGTKDCDHWHQGAGFVTSHVAFTLEFEQALQSVYPSLSIPYWDFTIESTFYEPRTWRSSPIFADDWFGAASPQNDLHVVTKGRWSFVRSMTQAATFSDVHNSYGVLRAPWNNDPTPFMTRHDKIYGYENNMKPSGCKEYAVAIKKTKWMSMSRQLNSAAHGHIHETMGGSWNHFYADDNNNRVDPAVLTFAHEIQALSKELWRAGYIECPDACSMDTPWQECQCQCTAESLRGKAAYEILDDAGVLSAVQYYDHEGHLIEKWRNDNGTVYYTLPGYSDDQSHRIYDQLLRVLCTPGHIGDMYQATSTNDMTFWVLHPTVDRLWHFKRLGDLSDYDETWEPYHTCYNHNPTDFQPFKSLFDNDNTFYTNAQLYNLLSPSDAVLPYTYDHFKWPHCSLVGHEIRNHDY